jgi:hypothetical protein
LADYRVTIDAGRDGPEQEWNLQVYASPHGATPWEASLRALDPVAQITLTTAIRVILAKQGNQVCETEWGKSLGKGLYEFRVRRTLATICRTYNVAVPAGVDLDQAVLLRAFFAVESQRVVLLLSCYDKGKDATERRQNREIRKARKLLKEHIEYERRRQRRGG